MAEVINEADYETNEAEFSALADYVFDQMHVNSDVEVNIISIEPKPTEDLHVRQLDLPGPTSVISFPVDKLRPGTTDHPTPPDMLSDICIYLQVAAHRAAKPGHDATEETLLLATYGTLHLLGYNHATGAECEVMFAFQHKLLLTFLASR